MMGLWTTQESPMQRATACTPLKALRVEGGPKCGPQTHVHTPLQGTVCLGVRKGPLHTSLKEPKPQDCSLQGHRQGSGLISNPIPHLLPEIGRQGSWPSHYSMNLELWRMGWFGSRQVHPSPHRSFSGTPCHSLHQSGTENQSGPSLELGYDSLVGNKMARDTMGKAGRKHHKT